MPCYHPINAYQATPGARIEFPKTGASNLKLPCGRCVGCRLERSKQWALRLMHEAQLHEANSFVTLTYNNDSLAKGRDEFEDSPSRPRRPAKESSASSHTEKSHAYTATLTREDSLSKRHAQLFMKRLRRELTTRGSSARLKYYLVGEYGDRLGRPHYHLALFGEDFSGDRYQWRHSASGNILYRSPRLEKIWPYGHCEVGELTFESAAYVARYILKKINGKQATEHYKRIDHTTGEIYWITPEFALMSRGGRTGKGIGSGWFEKFAPDIYPHDYAVMRGKKHKPPRYYDKLLEKIDAEAAALIKLEREFTARSNAADNTPSRLRAKEKVALARAAQSKRPLE